MNEGREQAGFRKNFSTVDNIFALNQIIEKTTEYINFLHARLRYQYPSESELHRG